MKETEISPARAGGVRNAGRSRGRPSKFSPERSEKVLLGIRQGNSQRVAAALAGVDEATLLRWRQNYADFAALYTRAEAEAEARNVASIQKAATEHAFVVVEETKFPDGSIKRVLKSRSESDWKAALAWLERRRPQEWGRKETVKLTGTGENDAVQVEQTTDSESRDLMRSIADSNRLMAKALEQLERESSSGQR